VARGIEARYLRPGGNRRVRRRRRARVALKVSLWIALWLAGAGLAAAGFAQGWKLMKEPDRFPVTRVAVRGGDEALDAEVRASIAGVLNKNMLTMDLHAIESRVLAHPWVKEASVWRQIPGTIQVLIEPRTVAALVEEDGEIRMLAADGADLGPLTPRYAGEDHVVITGAGSPDAREKGARLQRGLQALRRLESERPGFAASLSALDVSRSDRLEATMRDYWPPVYLNPLDPVLNVDRLDAVRERLDDGGVTPAYVDLRFKDRIAVLPAAGDEVSDGA